MSNIRLKSLLISTSCRTVNTTGELTTALQDQISCIILIPATFSIASTLTIPANTTLLSENQNGSILQATSGLSGNIISISSNNVTIQGVQFDTSSNTTADAIGISGTANDITIKDCKFTGGNGSGEYIAINSTSTDLAILNCDFESSTSTGHQISFLGTVTRVSITSCSFGSVTASADSINIGGTTSQVNITRCRFESSSGTALTTGSSASKINTSKCSFTSVTTIAEIASNHCTFVGNTLLSSAGLQITGTSASSIVSGNVFDTASGTAITVTGSNEQSIITNNKILAYTTGLSLVSDALVTSNLIDNCTTGINASGSFSGNIQNNTLSNNTTPLTLSGSGYSVKDNIIDTETITPAAAAEVEASGVSSGGRPVITGSGTAFNTNFVAGDVIVYGAGEEVIARVGSATRMSTTVNTGSIGATSGDRAERITLTTGQAHNSTISVDSSTNPARIIIPDLTSESQGHKLTIEKTSASHIVVIHPNTYGTAVFRQLELNDPIELLWTGTEWIDVQRRVTIVKFNKSVSQSSSNGVVTTVTWSDIDANSAVGGIGYESSTGASNTIDEVFAPYSGWYNITWQLSWTSYAAGTRTLTFMEVNGSGAFFRQETVMTTASPISFIDGGDIYLTAGDAVTVQIFQSSGSARSLDNISSADCEFIVQYLGKQS